MMENRHYLGDNFYPAIIDKEIFESAAAERIKRANKLGRLNHKRVIKPSVVPTYFHLAAAVQHYDDPRLQAEYLYSLIESEGGLMGNVMVIPARRQVGNTVKKSEQPKLRVAAYRRVSTDSDEQETSYDAQVTHYTEYIQKIRNGSWRESSPMTASPAPTQRSVRNSTV